MGCGENQLSVLDMSATPSSHVELELEVSDAKDGSGMPAQDVVDQLKEKHAAGTLGLIGGSDVLEVVDSTVGKPIEWACQPQ